MVVDPAQVRATSVATTSITLTRNGVPSMTPLHPRQRIATLSCWRVGIRIPMMSNGTGGE